MCNILSFNFVKRCNFHKSGPEGDCGLEKNKGDIDPDSDFVETTISDIHDYFVDKVTFFTEKLASVIKNNYLSWLDKKDDSEKHLSYFL